MNCMSGAPGNVGTEIVRLLSPLQRDRRSGNVQV